MTNTTKTLEEARKEGREEFADKVAQDLLKMQDIPGIGIIAKTAADFVLDTLNEVNQKEQEAIDSLRTVRGKETV